MLIFVLEISNTFEVKMRLFAILRVGIFSCMQFNGSFITFTLKCSLFCTKGKEYFFIFLLGSLAFPPICKRIGSNCSAVRHKKEAMKLKVGVREQK